MGIFGLINILLYNIILMLLVTLIIASLTLIERKFLSLLQRRVGPNYVGYKGRLQYIADALKLFVKGVLIPYESNRFWFVLIPSIALAICYSFWINSVWGPSLSIFDIEYNTVYASLLSIIFSFCIVLTGFFSRNKYAMLASIRTILLVLNLEIFLGLLILNLVTITESFNFTTFVLFQENVWLIFLYFGLFGVITITFLLEVNRAPFDLAEAESELITGYSTELGGFHFGLYYLGEYFHLFFFSMTIVIFFLGGWELPNTVFLNKFNFCVFSTSFNSVYFMVIICICVFIKPLRIKNLYYIIIAVCTIITILYYVYTNNFIYNQLLDSMNVLRIVCGLWVSIDNWCIGEEYILYKPVSIIIKIIWSFFNLFFYYLYYFLKC